MSAKPLNLAIVGLGYWGPTLLRALVEVEGVEVGWVCDSDKSRLERSRRRYPLRAPPRESTISSPTRNWMRSSLRRRSSHFYLASRALSAGKHVFVEKPLATSSAEADQLARLAEMEGLVLMCGHTFIYSPPVRAVKELLDQGALGQVYFVSSSRVNLGLHQSDISVVWDLGPHDFSILLYWFEEMPTTIRAVGRDSVVKGITDVAFVTMDFPSGILANVELSWLAPSKLRRTVIVGSEKMVVYDDVSVEPLRVFDHGVVYEDPETFGQYRLSYRTGDIVSPKVDTVEPVVVELEDFVAAVRAGASPHGHLELARNVTRLTEAAETSLEADGSLVSPARPTLLGRRL